MYIIFQTTVASTTQEKRKQDNRYICQFLPQTVINGADGAVFEV